MLVRKQILLEEKQVFELEALAAFHDMSFSEAMREGANMITKKIKAVKKPVEKRLALNFYLNKPKKLLPDPEILSMTSMPMISKKFLWIPMFLLPFGIPKIQLTVKQLNWPMN